MAKFTIISGSLKRDGRMHVEGEEVDLDHDEAARINKKGSFLEQTEIIQAKAKAEADAKAAIAKAEKEAQAKAKAEADAKAAKGGKS